MQYIFQDLVVHDTLSSFKLKKLEKDDLIDIALSAQLPVFEETVPKDVLVRAIIINKHKLPFLFDADQKVAFITLDGTVYSFPFPRNVDNCKFSYT